ncbi:MAG: hypothetical protein ACLSHC_16850 [Bilophila wadsworthia]
MAMCAFAGYGLEGPGLTCPRDGCDVRDKRAFPSKTDFRLEANQTRTGAYASRGRPPARLRRPEAVAHQVRKLNGRSCLIRSGGPFR